MEVEKITYIPFSLEGTKTLSKKKRVRELKRRVLKARLYNEQYMVRLMFLHELPPKLSKYIKRIEHCKELYYDHHVVVFLG